MPSLRAPTAARKASAASSVIAPRLFLGAAGLIMVDKISLVTVRDAGRQGDAMPRSPGAVELAYIGQAVVVQRRTVPSRLEAVADKRRNLGLPPISIKNREIE